MRAIGIQEGAEHRSRTINVADERVREERLERRVAGSGERGLDRQPLARLACCTNPSISGARGSVGWANAPARSTDR
jgi:hypothetical protein